MRRSRITSMLPVPLNSSKITSSMREPVSIKAVAMIVSEPPSSMLRAAPKNRAPASQAIFQRAAFFDVARRAEKSLGTLERVGIDTAGKNLAAGRHHRVVRARQAGDRIE